MSGWCDRFRRDARGVSAVEFAFLLPVLLVIVLSLTELGRGFLQANAVEKGLRAGGLYAARAEFPLSAADRDVVTNLVKTATVDGSGGYLVAGWADGAASLAIEAPTTYTVDEQSVPVHRLTAAVPFDALFPGLMSSLGLDDAITIGLTHEQAHIGT